MPSILTKGLLLRRTRRFFPTGGRDHRQYTLRLPTEGWPGLGGLVKYQDGIPAYTVTHPSTNRARRRAITLIKANALPLSQTATV